MKAKINQNINVQGQNVNNLSPFVKDVVVGKLLLDASASINAAQTKAVLRVAHGGLNYEMYLLYCLKCIISITGLHKIKHIKKYDKRYSNWSYQGYFDTDSCYSLISLVKSFYPESKRRLIGSTKYHKKVVPDNI